MESSVYLYLLVLMYVMGELNGASIATVAENNGNVNQDSIIKTQTAIAEPPNVGSKLNTGFTAQEMGEFRGAGVPRQIGANPLGQHNEFEWQNPQVVGTNSKGLNGQQFFRENENEGMINGIRVNGMVDQEFGELEGPRAFQQVTVGNADNGNWNQKDYVWGDYGWEEPNRWKRQVENEGGEDGRMIMAQQNNVWDGIRMINADNGWDQWNENELGNNGNERKKRATKMKDVNQWVMRGITNVNFADIDWAGQIARAIAKWNRMQVSANNPNGDPGIAISTTNVPNRDPGTVNPITDVPNKDTGTMPTTDVPIGDIGTAIATTNVPNRDLGTVNPITDVPNKDTGTMPTTDVPIGDIGTAIATTNVPNKGPGTAIPITDVPNGDIGTAIPTTDVPNGDIGRAIPTTDVPNGDTGTAIPITDVPTGDPRTATDNGFIDIPGTTWSPRQIGAGTDDYTWSDYRPGEQQVQQFTGVDYMIDNGQDPEFPPKVTAKFMKTQGGERQIQADNKQIGEKGIQNLSTTNELSAVSENTDYYNADYGLAVSNRKKRAPPSVKSVNEWILRDIRKVNFADDDWLGQIAMAIAVWNQRKATDKNQAVHAHGVHPGDIPLVVPVSPDVNFDVALDAATTVVNIPSSMNINAPVFEAPTTPVNEPATINALVADPTLGAVNVPSSMNDRTSIILPTIPDVTSTNIYVPVEGLTTAEPDAVRGIVPPSTSNGIDFVNEDKTTRNDQEPSQLIDPPPAVTASVQDYSAIPNDWNQVKEVAPANLEPWMADANRGDYGWGDYAWTENRAVKVDQWGKKHNAQNIVDYNYRDYNGQKQVNGGAIIGTTPDYTDTNYGAVDYGNVDYGVGKQVTATVDTIATDQWKGDFIWTDNGWVKNTNDRRKREIENEGWWDKRQLKGFANGFDYQMKHGKKKRATTIDDLNKWIMGDIGKVNFGDDDWLGQIAMAIVTWRERAMAESRGKTVTNGDTPNLVDNADIGTQIGQPNDNGEATPISAVNAIPDLQFETQAPRALNAPNSPAIGADINNVVEADTQAVQAPRGLVGPWNADYVAGDYSWGKPPLVSLQNIYNEDYNWLDYAVGNLLDTGNQGDYNWGAVDYVGQQPTVPENQANPEANVVDVGFETNPKMMDGTNLFNVDYGNTDYGIDGQNQVAKTKGQVNGGPGNVQQIQEAIGEVNPDYQMTTEGSIRPINAGQQPNAGETNWQDNARKTDNPKWLGDFNWGDYGWGGNTNDRKKREVENEGWWDVRKLRKPENGEYKWNDYGLSMERAKRAGTNMKIAKAVNEWVLRDINNVNFADDDWPGMIAQSIATWKRHFLRTGHKALGFDKMQLEKVVTGNDGTKVNPENQGVTNEPLGAPVDGVTTNIGMANGVTNSPELNNINGAATMAINAWNDKSMANTDYYDYAPETTTFVWSTDAQMSNTIDGGPLMGGWNKQINQAETEPITQRPSETITINAYAGVDGALKPIRQVKSKPSDTSIAQNIFVENPDITESTTIQQDTGRLFTEPYTMDIPASLAVRGINAATNVPSEPQSPNIQDNATELLANQRVPSEGTDTTTNGEINPFFTNAQIDKLKMIAAGNDVQIGGATGDLNEVNWFDYGGFGEYEGGVMQLNGGFIEEPAVQGNGAGDGNVEINDYKWVDYGTQQFTDYDGPGAQQGVEKNILTGDKNEPDYKVFEINNAGFVDGQNREVGNEPWRPSGIVWNDYGGNRMKREADEAETGSKNKLSTLSRNQRIVLLHGLRNLFKTALMNYREGINRTPQWIDTYTTTNRKDKTWLSRRLAAFNLKDELPVRRYVVPSELDNWWSRKQIYGGGRENGRNKRNVFGHKDVGHDVNDINRRVSMPDAHFRQHEFSSSLLGGKKPIKHTFTGGVDGPRGNLKGPISNGMILSKTENNDVKRSSDRPYWIDPVYVRGKSSLANTNVDFRATAPHTASSLTNGREANQYVRPNQKAQITHNVDFLKNISHLPRGKDLDKVLDEVLKIARDAEQGYIESVQNNVDKSV